MNAAPDAGVAPRPQVTAAMQSVLRAVTDLQPYLASPLAFKDPSNAAFITSQLDSLRLVKHTFLGKRRQDTEPGEAAMASLFGDTIDRARESFGSGRQEIARNRLRGLTGLCFSCHSQKAAPADFTDAEKRVASLDLPVLERAEFYAATRQFDKALALWATLLSADASRPLDTFEHLRALRLSLSVLVRVKEDAPAAARLIRSQLDNANIPPFTARTLQQWQTDVTAWKNEKFRSAEATPAALFARAKQLVDSSAAAKSLSPDDSQWIRLWRASGYLHQALAKEPDAPWRVQALYLLGLASSSLQDPLVGAGGGLYLEACVREHPHSPLARACADRLFEAAWFDYTGSGGTAIPPDVSRSLEALRELAK